MPTIMVESQELKVNDSFDVNGLPVKVLKIATFRKDKADKRGERTGTDKDEKPFTPFAERVRQGEEAMSAEYLKGNVEVTVTVTGNKPITFPVGRMVRVFRKAA